MPPDGAPRVYLAGPDVFVSDAPARGAALKAVCARHGLLGVFPLDAPGDIPAAWQSLPEAHRIARCNEAHIRASAALIANLTPFRGPSADVGTVYEIGFARGLGLKVFGYATVATAFLDRTLSAVGGGRQAADGSWWDQDGLLVEQFGLFDNLMIEGGITESGGALLRDDQDRWNDLTVFERCIQAAASAIRGPDG